VPAERRYGGRHHSVTGGDIIQELGRLPQESASNAGNLNFSP
jgi:hypothetical protein